MSTVLENHFDPNYDPSAGEIEEYGKWLGMTLPEDADLLWLAKEGLCAPLPEHWKACKSEKGELYYFNFNTGKSIWDHPMDEHFKSRLAEEKAKRVQGINKENENKKESSKKKETKKETKVFESRPPSKKSEALVPPATSTLMVLEGSEKQPLGNSQNQNGVNQRDSVKQHVVAENNSVFVSDSSAESSPNPSSIAAKNLLPSKKVKPLTELNLGDAAKNATEDSNPTPRSNSGNSKLAALKKLKNQTSSSTLDEYSSRESSITSNDNLEANRKKSKRNAAASVVEATPSNQKLSSSATPGPSVSPIPMTGDSDITAISMAALVSPVAAVPSHVVLPSAASKLAPLSASTPAAATSSITNTLEIAKRDATALFEKEMALFRKAEELRVKEAIDKIKSESQEAIAKARLEAEAHQQAQTTSYKSSLELVLQNQTKTLQQQFEDKSKKIQTRHDEDLERYIQQQREVFEKAKRDSLQNFEKAFQIITLEAADQSSWKAALTTLEIQMEEVLAERQSLLSRDVLLSTSASLATAKAALIVEHEQQIKSLTAEHATKLLQAEEKHTQILAASDAATKAALAEHEAAILSAQSQLLVQQDKLKVIDEDLRMKNKAKADLEDALATLQRKSSSSTNKTKSPLLASKAPFITKVTSNPSAVGSAYDSDGTASSSAEVARSVVTRLNTHFGATTKAKDKRSISSGFDSHSPPTGPLRTLDTVLVSSEERDEDAVDDDIATPTMTGSTTISPTAPAVTAAEVRTIVADVLRNLFSVQQQIHSRPIDAQVLQPQPTLTQPNGRAPLFTQKASVGANPSAVNLDVTLPVSFREQHDMLASERQRLVSAKQFLQFQQEEIAERRASLKEARKQWKKDVFKAKAEGYRSDSQKGQLLKNVHTVLEKQAAGLAHDEMILSESQTWLGTKEMRLTQLEDQLTEAERLVMARVPGEGSGQPYGLSSDISFASVETAALISDFFQNESLLVGGGSKVPVSNPSKRSQPASSLTRKSSSSMPVAPPTPQVFFDPSGSVGSRQPAVSDALDRIERRLEKFAKLLLSKSTHGTQPVATYTTASHIPHYTSTSSPTNDHVSGGKKEKEYRRHKSTERKSHSVNTPAPASIKRSSSGKRVDFAFPAAFV